jgi:hypothetical protein
LEQHGHVDSVAHGADEVIDRGDNDVVDVEVQEINQPGVLALPSPAPDAETEAELWKRWTAMGRGRQLNS